jgi:hypothetical protein
MGHNIQYMRAMAIVYEQSIKAGEEIDFRTRLQQLLEQPESKAVKVTSLLHTLKAEQIEALLMEGGFEQHETITNVHHVGNARYQYIKHHPCGNSEEKIMQVFIDNGEILVTRPQPVEVKNENLSRQNPKRMHFLPWDY